MRSVLFFGGYMCRVLLLACCLTVAATAAPTVPIVVPTAIPTAAPVPKGASPAPKPKDIEEEKKAAYYKSLREGYEGLRDSLPREDIERCGLESDMNLAREVAQERLDIEKIVHPKSKALHLEGWETCSKPQVMRTPRRKELFEIYTYELGPLTAVAPRPEEVEKARAEYFKALRQVYDGELAMHPRGPDRIRLQADMELARGAAQERLDIEKSGHPVLKTVRLEKWEAGSKREVMRTPRLKELFELYSHELSQKK